jgi:hypothetical protein
MSGINWIDPLLNKAKAEAAEIKNETNKKLIEETLGVVEKNKDSLQNLGEQGFKMFMGMLGRGDTAKAKEVFLQNVMDPEALIEDADNAAGNIMDAPSVNWEKVALDIISDVAEIGARMLCSVLLPL